MGLLDLLGDSIGYRIYTVFVFFLHLFSAYNLFTIMDKCMSGGVWIILASFLLVISAIGPVFARYMIIGVGKVLVKAGEGVEMLTEAERRASTDQNTGSS